MFDELLRELEKLERGVSVALHIALDALCDFPPTTFSAYGLSQAA